MPVEVQIDVRIVPGELNRQPARAWDLRLTEQKNALRAAPSPSSALSSTLQLPALSLFIVLRL